MVDRLARTDLRPSEISKGSRTPTKLDASETAKAVAIRATERLMRLPTSGRLGQKFASGRVPPKKVRHKTEDLTAQKILRSTCKTHCIPSP